MANMPDTLEPDDVAYIPNGEVKSKGISPKAVGAVVAAIVAYLLTQEVVDFPAWADLIINVVAVGLAAAFSPLGTLVRR